VADGKEEESSKEKGTEEKGSKEKEEVVW